MIIKGIVCSLIFLVILTEIILLRCKIHIDLKIISVILKILTIVLFTFFLIEGKNNRINIIGGLIMY